jgi:two-component system KDP operon response regulator KdpE
MTLSAPVTPRTTPATAPLPAAAAVHRRSPLSDQRRILLCDAESQTLQALRVVLRGAGFEVDATRNAADALDHSALRLPTAAIIELVLPDGDGVQVCRRLREWSAMPVILLTAVCDEHEQVRALEAGADDYVTKPFRPRELVARLHAHLRRAEPACEQPSVELGGLEIDLASRAVRRGGDEIHLTPMEFKLLTVLLQNRGRLLTHTALLQQVWGPAYIDARQTLRAHIANLRRKIEPIDGEPLIHTDHGIGYRLAATHPHPATPALPADALIDPQAAHTRVLSLHDPSLAGRTTPSRRRGLHTACSHVA